VCVCVCVETAIVYGLNASECIKNLELEYLNLIILYIFLHFKLHLLTQFLLSLTNQGLQCFFGDYSGRRCCPVVTICFNSMMLTCLYF
jgi:hypothetical protein